VKRILACLAALALPTAAAAADPPSAGYDPIGDAIAAASAPAQPGAIPSASDTAADWSLRASLYHGGHRMSGRDSIGCRVSAMRTVAIDPAIVARHSIVYIKETVGMRLADGGVHDGYWYASDVGPAIKGAKIDLFTGEDAASMRAMMPLNLKTLSVTRVGEFVGCPPSDGGESAQVASSQ
jgi:3D (Asp-Asp-Asp) domain-containing protein